MFCNHLFNYKITVSKLLNFIVSQNVDFLCSSVTPKTNEYSNELVQNQLTMDDLFL